MWLVIETQQRQTVVEKSIFGQLLMKILAQWRHLCVCILTDNKTFQIKAGGNN